MLPDTGIDDFKKQRNDEYAKHINDPVLSSFKMEGIRLLFYFLYYIPCYSILPNALIVLDENINTLYKIWNTSGHIKLRKYTLKCY
jgi:hypothetical protein